MEIEKKENGAYIIQAIDKEEERMLDAMLVALSAFEKSFYPVDNSTDDYTQD